MTTNEIWTLGIAAYAAVISTFVLGWDAYKWFDSGPKVRLTSNTGMRLVGGNLVDTNVYVSATAVNLGDRATTITNLGFLYYSSWFKAMIRRRRPDQAFVIATPSQSQSIPFRFDPGAQWLGLAEQDEQLVRLSRNGYLYVVLYHSHGGNGVRHRVAPIRATTDTSQT
jgi:hypothetical protein